MPENPKAEGQKETLPAKIVEPIPDSLPSQSEPRITIGDLVRIPFLNEQGIVCSNPDAKGNIRVLVKGKKLEVAFKRVELKISGEQLYPEGYDLNQILLSKDERRAKHELGRKHVPGLVRTVSPDEQ